MSPFKARSRFVQVGSRSRQAGLARFHMSAILEIYRNYVRRDPVKSGPARQNELAWLIRTAPKAGFPLAIIFARSDFLLLSQPN